MHWADWKSICFMYVITRCTLHKDCIFFTRRMLDKWSTSSPIQTEILDLKHWDTNSVMYLYFLVFVVWQRDSMCEWPIQSYWKPVWVSLPQNLRSCAVSLEGLIAVTNFHSAREGEAYSLSLTAKWNVQPEYCNSLLWPRVQSQWEVLTFHVPLRPFAEVSIFNI